MEVFDAHPCTLGEGPLWHPQREELFWFDILGNTLRSKARIWSFDEHVSAAGWIDHTQLLIASETHLFTFDLEAGTREKIVDLEANNPITRSNDGRADPYGGFWIGTIGKAAEPGAGAIYRLYKGELRLLYPQITVSNAICFAPDGGCAYFTDSRDRRLMRVALDKEGWPKGDPDVILDCRDESFSIDGAITTADGSILNAQWGAGRVMHYSPTGDVLGTFDVPATRSSCPALGGPDLSTLYVTSARQGMTEAELAKDRQAGQTFAVTTALVGHPEPQVIL